MSKPLFAFMIAMCVVLALWIVAMLVTGWIMLHPTPRTVPDLRGTDYIFPSYEAEVEYYGPPKPIEVIEVDPNADLRREYRERYGDRGMMGSEGGSMGGRGSRRRRFNFRYGSVSGVIEE